MALNQATASYSAPTTDVCFSLKSFCVNRPNKYNSSPKSAEMYGLGKIIKRIQPSDGAESGVLDSYSKSLKELPSRKNVENYHNSPAFRGTSTFTPNQVATAFSDVSLERPYADNVKQLKSSPSNKSLNAELYGIGKALKRLQPPGGTESGVFDAFRKPLKELPDREKAKDRFKSRVFQDSFRSPPHRETPLKQTTLYRIFQKTPPTSPRSLRNKFKSTVFDPDPPKQRREIKVKRDPITGCHCKTTDGEVLCKKYIIRNPITFEGVNEKDRCIRALQPPGGASTLVLEYDETPRSF